jgi:O-antigen/teichoic acid export membrane protein
MKYFKNSSWMMGENLLKIISGIFVGIYVARYLGPEQFGILSYVLAVVSVFMAIGRLGMDSILVRDIAKFPLQAKLYLNSAFTIIFVLSFFFIFVLAIGTYFLETDSRVQLYMYIVAVGLVFQSFLVVDYNFQALLKAKYSSLAKVPALVVSSIIKVGLVWLEADLLYFVIASLFDQIVIAFLLVMVHFKKKQPVLSFDVDSVLAKSLLKSAWPIVISSAAVMLYMRIDQIMIKHYLGMHDLGLYSAASKVAGAWSMIIVIASLSLTSALVQMKQANNIIEYENKLINLYSFFLMAGLLATFVSMFVGNWLIGFLFGSLFEEAGIVFIILMLSAPFVAIGSLSMRYFYIEGLEKKIAIRSIVGLAVNIPVNMVFIPVWGINGAALSTVMTIIFISYLFNYFDKDTVRLRKLINSAILFKGKVV